MFNTLKYTQYLEGVGLPREQAEAHIQIMSEIMELNLATKQDIKDLAVATKQDIKDLAIITQQDIKDLREELHEEVGNLRRDIRELATDFNNKIIQSEYRMTIKLGTIVSVAIGVAVALTRLI